MENILRKSMLTFAILLFCFNLNLNASMNEEVKDIKALSTKASTGMLWYQDQDGCARLRKRVLVPRSTFIDLPKTKISQSRSILSSRSTSIEDLLQEFSPTHQTQAINLLKKATNKIASNFFPEVYEGKLSIDELSSKCMVDLEEISICYKHYLQSLHE